MKKNSVLVYWLLCLTAVAVPGRAAGADAQSPGLPAATGQIAAAEKDLLEFLPASTAGVLVLNVPRLLGIPPVAKALQGLEFEKVRDDFVKLSGIDLGTDIAYVGWGMPASAITGQFSTPPSPPAFKDMALVVGLRSDKTRLHGLVKEKLPEAKEEIYDGVAVFSLVNENKPTGAAPGVPAEVGMMNLQFAFLDDSHIVAGGDLGVKGVIDVYQKRSEPLAKDAEMAAFMSRVDKSGIAWSVVSYPPELAKMIAAANPLLKAIEGFKGMITAIDDNDTSLIVDLRTLGGTPEQNAAFASNLTGLKAVGALYTTEQPALAELLTGVAVTSGEDYTRLTVTVSHETIGKLALLMEPKNVDPNSGPKAEGTDWEVLFKQAEDLGREGQTDRALEAYEQALQLADRKLGPDHPDLAKILDKMADLYCRDNLPQNALPLIERALAIREKALGPDNPDMAEGLNGLAAFYEELGQDAKAVTFYNRLLTVQEKALGPDHPQVATVLDKLARLDYYQGRYSAAEPLWRRSLAIKEKALGPTHPDVATNLYDLAMLLQVQEKYAAAEPL